MECRRTHQHHRPALLGGAALVVDEEVWDVVPHIAVLVQVGHGGLQRGLQCGSVVLKEPQHQRPQHCSEQRKWVPLGFRNVAFLHAQAAQGKQDTWKQVHGDLQGGSGRGLPSHTFFPPPMHGVTYWAWISVFQSWCARLEVVVAGVLILLFYIFNLLFFH